MSDQADLERRREEAKLALGGEKLAEKNKELEKRRQEARTAMEGEDFRERRQMREKASAAAVERKQQATAAKEAAVKATQEAKDKLAAALAAREQAEAKAAAERKENAATAAETTARLRKSGSTLSAFHTIKTDMAKAVREQGLSLSKIATISQQRDGGPIAVQPPNRWGVFFATFFVLIAAAGLVGWWWFNYREVSNATVPQPTVSNSVMRAETQREIVINTNTNVNQLRTSVEQIVSSASSTPGFTNIYFTRGGEVITFANFRDAMQLDLPESLTRHLSDNYFFGVYDSGETRSPFLVIQTNFFDQAWAAMLEWETYMSSDLSILLKTPTNNQGVWSDKVLRNRDIRRETDTAGNVTLVYGFINDGTIVITKNEAVFTKVFERLIDQS
jgi:hypothetical protein